MCVCEKILQWNVIEKKNEQKKLPNPPLKNLMVRPQPQDITTLILFTFQAG